MTNTQPSVWRQWWPRNEATLNRYLSQSRKSLLPHDIPGRHSFWGCVSVLSGHRSRTDCLPSQTQRHWSGENGFPGMPLWCHYQGDWPTDRESFPLAYYVLLLQQLLVMSPTLTSSGGFLVLGVGSCTRWGTGSDRGTVAAAADAQRWEENKPSQSVSL